jgi:hypothetical protein
MSRIIKAIQKINPNAEVSIKDDDINTLVWHNDTTPISNADIEAELVNIPTAAEEAQAKIDAQASGNQKLLDLGLTQAEATALTGYTPPAEV